MNKIILFLIILIMLSTSVIGVGVTRSINGNDITLTINGVEGRFGLIVSENIPIGFNPAGIASQNVGVEGTVSSKVTGQLYEIAIASSTSPAIVTYRIGGTGTGTISGKYKFASNLGSGVITGDSQLNIVGTCDCSGWVDKECGGGDCTERKRLQSRTCTPSLCNIEQRCVKDYGCEAGGIFQITKEMIYMIIIGVFIVGISIYIYYKKKY